MTHQIKLFIFIASITFLALSVFPAFAQVVPIFGQCGFPGQFCWTTENTLDVRDYLIYYIDLAIFLVGALAIIFLIYAGYKYIISGSDEAGAKQAKTQILFAIIGLIVVMGAGTIADVIIGVGRTGDSEAGANTLTDLIVPVINALLILVGITAAIFIVVAGVRYITSGGQEEIIRTAKRQLIFSIAGLIVVILSAALVNLVIIPLGGNAITAFEGTYTGDIVPGITLAVNALLTLVGILAAIFIVVAGVKYITSGGDEEATRSAKRQLIYAMLGLVFVILSSVIVNLILIPFV